MVIPNTMLWFLTVIASIEAVKPFKNARGPSGIIKQFPYLVGLAAADGPININETVCSGTLVSPDFVLTSAHCTLLLETKKIRVFSRKSATSIKTRLAAVVYVHRSYDSRLRLYDLSLVKLKRPFTHVNRFVKLSSKKFDRDQDMDCMVVGIRGADGNSYKVPVRAKYGRSACQIPDSNPVLKYVLGDTWTDFLCTQTVGPFPPRLPCGRSDPLLCDRNRQYGILSYGYGVDAANSGSEPVECSDPDVQSRSLYVNKHYKWIANLVSGNPEDKVLVTTTDRVDGHSPNATSAIAPTPTIPTSTSSSTPTVQTPTSSSTPTVQTPTSFSTPTSSSTPTKRVASTPDDYPYLVRLEGLADEPTCGGTLISPYHVLTSAYCTTRMSTVHVFATNQRQLFTSPHDIYLPVTFDVPTLTADISIIVLRDPFNVNKYAELGDFPDPSDANETTVMSCAIVAKTPEAPHYYRKSVNARYGAKACQHPSVLKIRKYIDQTSREFICGLYKNRLKEDAGNPLICNGKQYGIISHGYQIEHPNANITQQMRFLAVKNYKRWIAYVVAKTDPLTSKGIRVKNHRCGLIMTITVLLLSDVFRRS